MDGNVLILMTTLICAMNTLLSKRSTDYVPRSVSLHIQRIACESPICEN